MVPAERTQHFTRPVAATMALSAAILLAPVLLATAALAEDEAEDPTPRIEFELDVEIQDDWTFDSDDPDGSFNNLFTTTEPAIAVHLFPGLSLQGGFVLEEVRNTTPGEDREFQEHGFYAEQLFLQYEHDAFSVFGGKFNPSFGIAWYLAPGIYGTEVAEDTYEQTERIGFGGALNFGGAGIGGDGFGEHSLTAQTFFLDTSVFSESLGTNKGPVRLSDGGPSNTEDLSSFSVTLDGVFPDLPASPGYHLGVIRQEGGQGDPEDEVGVAAGLFAAIELAEDLTLEPLLEYVHLFDAEAQDQERDVITGALGLYYGPWNMAVSHASSFTDRNDPMLDPADLHTTQVSAGYSFDFGLDVDLGYKYVQENSTDSHTVGVLFHYNVDFAVP